MAVADRSIDPKILDSAKKEFLDKGYDGASLQEICRHAGVTTGALYKRFSGKQDLYNAVVQPTLDAVYAMVEQTSLPDLRLASDEELIEAWRMRSEQLLIYFRLFYEHREGIILLMERSSDESGHSFSHDFSSKLSAMTLAYYDEGYRRGLFRRKISPLELHTLYTAFSSVIFEPVIHGMSWEEIEHHAGLMCEFFDWFAVLDVDEMKSVRHH